jgi:hypothetical protein
LKKSATIFLLIILLFNMAGYRAWFYYAESKSDAAIESRLDNNQYDQNELVSITIPLDNPYQLEQKNFERVQGEFSFQGNTYKYVKRRISNNNLIILCIPDAHKTILKKAGSAFGNATNDFTGNGKGSSRSGTQKSFNGPDFISQCTNVQMCRCADATAQKHDFSIGYIPKVYLSIPGKPPKSLA